MFKNCKLHGRATLLQSHSIPKIVLVCLNKMKNKMKQKETTFKISYSYT